MKKTILAIFMAGLMLVTIFSALSVSAAPRGKKEIVSGNGGISFRANGATSYTFETTDGSFTFHMTIGNTYYHDVSVTIETEPGGDSLYFSYTVSGGSYVVPARETTGLSITVNPECQSPDTIETVTFTVTCKSGYTDVGSLSFSASVLPGDDNDSQPSQIEPIDPPGKPSSILALLQQ